MCAFCGTHERELGEIKTSPTIGLYTQIHKKENLGVLSELDWNWWPRPGSNRRHTDFQSVALPTELPSHRFSVHGENGRSTGIRTLDPVIKSHLLYQLSYAPIHRIRGARNGIRTRDNHLGKVALYQLSYPRIAKTGHIIPQHSPRVQGGIAKYFIRTPYLVKTNPNLQISCRNTEPQPLPIHPRQGHSRNETDENLRPPHAHTPSTRQSFVLPPRCLTDGSARPYARERTPVRT